MIETSAIASFISFFLFSSQLWGLFWTTGKNLAYLLVFFFVLKYVNPKLSKTIKEILVSIIRFDFSSTSTAVKKCIVAVGDLFPSDKEYTKKESMNKQ